MTENQMEMSFPVGPETVNILGVVIPLIEYRGERVLTFRMIDTAHQKADGQARKQFDAHRSRFEMPRDFYRLDSVGMTELQAHAPGVFGDGARHGILLTRRGYEKITKNWNDERSWAVFEEMQGKVFLLEQMLSGEAVAIKQLAGAVDHHDEKNTKLINGLVGAFVVALRREVVKELGEMRDANYGQAVIINDKQKSIIEQMAVMISRMESVARVADPMAFNRDKYCDVNQVYGVAGVQVVIPRRHMLSANISRSLDGFHKRVRSDSGGFLYDIRQLDVGGRPWNFYQRELVVAWLAECGRRMIETHIRRFASAPLSVVQSIVAT